MRHHPPMAGRISEWQRRLDERGRVRFRQSPWLSVMFLVLGVVVTLGAFDAIVNDGPSVVSVVGAVFFGIIGIPLTIYGLVSGRPGLTVARDGIHAGSVVVPFANVVSITAHERALFVHYRPLPGQRLVLREKSTGLKQLGAVFSRFGGPSPGDLATWLFQLQAGPEARVEVTRRGGRLGELYELAEKPWWER